MKRRDFMKASAFAGTAGLAAQGCSQMGKGKQHSGPGFDVHPFVKSNPDAVFIHVTDVKEKTDKSAMRSIGKSLSNELIVKVPEGGWPFDAKVTVKPNWTSAGPKNGKPVMEKLGVNTDPWFVEGWVQGMRNAGPQDYYIRECCCPNQWEPMGYSGMCEDNGIDLRPLSKIDVWKLKKGKDITWVDVPDSVVMKKIAFQAPMNEQGSFLVNIAKLKSHGMGTTACIKNLQGITARRFHQFCTPTDSIRKYYEKPYLKYFNKNFEQHVKELYKKHVDDGYPRWGRTEPENRNGLWMEQWCQRMLDSYSVTPTGLNIVEGVYSQDGNGFGIGPHEKLGEHGVTSRDYMSNVVIFGIDAVRVDIISHYLAGHEPGNFGLFHIAIKRGLSDVLDPRDIPIYVWKDGEAEPARLTDFRRTPLVTYYLQRDWGGQKEPEFHLCDEPFDYGAWKKGARVGDCVPSFAVLGQDSEGRMIGQIETPQKDDVYVDVYDTEGHLTARLRAMDLEPGVHQVVWDGFTSPGLHNYYVRGMGWDAELREVIT